MTKASLFPPSVPGNNRSHGSRLGPSPRRSRPQPTPTARGSAFVHAAASPRARRRPPPARRPLTERPGQAGGRTPPAAPAPRGRAGSAPTVCPPPARHGAQRAAAACTRASAPTRVLPARGGPGTRAALPPAMAARPGAPTRWHPRLRPGAGTPLGPRAGVPKPGPAAREARWSGGDSLGG